MEERIEDGMLYERLDDMLGERLGERLGGREDR